MARILFCGGGSIGHLAPALAVLRETQAAASDLEAHFVCADRPEEMRMLEREHLPYTAIPALRFSFVLPLRFLRAMRISSRLLYTFSPDAIFSKGGNISLPLCIAAKLKGIPIVLHESDAVMGRANRVIAGWATVVCLGFPQKNTHYVVTGNPVRPGIVGGSRKEGLRITGLTGTKPILLVIGGSQGAQALNEIVRRLLPELLPLCDIIHLTGRGKSSGEHRPGYWAAEFAYEELPHLYAASSFALSRAGAGAVSELAANGIPSILVPLSGLAQDHQHANAQIAAATGGCILMEQEHLRNLFVPTVAKLVADNGTRERMSSTIRALHRPSASRQISEILLRCIAQRRKDH